MTTKVMLLGGTGAMGVYLVAELRKIGVKVYVTSRRTWPSTGDVRYLEGNAHDMRFVRQCVKEIHPDAIVDFMIYSTDEFRARVTELTAFSDQYVYLSSYRVLADEMPVSERTPRLLDVTTDPVFLATDIYPLAKARQENELIDKSAGNWTIVRPGITYSKERFQFGCLEANTVCFRSFRNVPVVIPSVMLDKTTVMTWGGDVAKMISRLILNSSCYNEVFLTASSETHTWREIYCYYRDLIGMSLVETPTLDEYERIIGSHYHYQMLFDRMFNRRIDNTKILRATGLQQAEFMPLRKGLEKELAYFRDHEYYGFMNIPENARMDAYCHSSIDLSHFSPEEVKQYKEAYDGSK